MRARATGPCGKRIQGPHRRQYAGPSAGPDRDSGDQGDREQVTALAEQVTALAEQVQHVTGGSVEMAYGYQAIPDPTPSKPLSSMDRAWIWSNFR